MYSQSEENYLKAIYLLGRKSDKLVNTNLLASRLKTRASSVTDMVKKLKEKALVDYQRYKGASLTIDGQKIALSVVRKHRLWETFLVRKLNFSWDEVHEIAEQLEHIQSPQLVDRLDAFLGHPTQDPHGDPIPDKQGHFPVIKRLPLSSFTVGDKVELVGLIDSSDEVLRYLDNRYFELGDVVLIEQIEDYDQSIQLQKKSVSFSISATAANNLLVKKI